jgi:hypothetical protein
MPATAIDTAGRANGDEELTPDVDAPHLTAPANAVPTRNGKGTVTLSDCARGVTSIVGDKAIGTAPHQREVPRSPTARSPQAEQ